MIMTILEAQVAPEQAATLEQNFQAGTAQLPPQIVQTFLARDTNDPTLWRIFTVWRSREALSEYRRSVNVPGGIQMFRSAGADPELSIWEVTSYGVGEAEGG